VQPSTPLGPDQVNVLLLLRAIPRSLSNLGADDRFPMNVKGYDSDGELRALQVSSQNDNIILLSARFSEAMSLFPSVETESILDDVIRDLTAANYSGNFLFQCRLENAKSKVRRSDFRSAIPHLISLLKTDENRTDLWLQLAICAQRTEDANLYRIATSRVRRLRPQLSFSVPAPALPQLILPPIPHRFVGYSMVTPCWRLFLQGLEKALQLSPYSVPVFQFAEPPLSFYRTETQYEIEQHPSMRFQAIPKVNKQRGVMKLGDYTLPGFFASLVAREFSPGTWTFSEPVLMLSATMVNKIATDFRFGEACPKDIAGIFIDIASRYLMEALTPSARLFLAELASAFRPEKCGLFLKDVNPPALHHQHALLRIAFALLEESIRNNNDYAILERQLMACRTNLDGKLFLGHAGVVLDQEILDQKAQQIRILKMISTCSSTVTDAQELFRHPEDLQFLSLANITALFLQFDDAAAESIFPSFLQLLPDLVRKNPSEVDDLTRVFEQITSPMSEECVQNLFSVLRSVGDPAANPSFYFKAALAIARASADLPDRATKLATLHRFLGKLGVCHAENGIFLEYLLEALLSRVDESENELTTTFSCYFSDVSLVAVPHHSQLHLRCSRFVQPFYDHVARIDDKNPNVNLFLQYFGLWKHWKSDCGCLTSIDGWRMYRHLKKHEALLWKRELPKGIQPQDVLEDLLRHDDVNRLETRIALSKVLIRSYVTATDPSSAKLEEAISLLSHSSVREPRFLLLRGLARAIRNDSPQDALTLLVRLPPFETAKSECRRLYWVMRILDESDLRPEAMGFAKQAITLLSKGLPPEYGFPLISLAAEILGDRNLLQQVIEPYAKSKPLSPYPYIALAKLSPPDVAFRLIAPLVRTTVPTIVNLFYFDFKPPFLMARPDDGARVRHEVLDIFVNSAAASGSYLKLFPLFNPSGKLDRKHSRALKSSPVLFGVNRITIFEKYTEELLKVVEKKGKLNRDMSERALDALVRASQLEVSEHFRELIRRLLKFTWEKMVGGEMPQDATVPELLRQITAEEEDDEEEDEEFIEESSSSEPTQGGKIENSKTESNEEASEGTEGEEEETTEQESQ
jgi:hypothetical protein